MPSASTIIYEGPSNQTESSEHNTRFQRGFQMLNIKGGSSICEEAGELIGPIHDASRECVDLSLDGSHMIEQNLCGLQDE